MLKGRYTWVLEFLYLIPRLRLVCRQMQNTSHVDGRSMRGLHVMGSACRIYSYS